MRIIALFNLKPGVARTDYEAWALSRDLPGVRSLASVTEFEVYRTTGVTFSGDAPPYEYVEVLDITAMDEFMKDVAGPTVESLALEMNKFTAKVTFMTTERLA